MGKPVKIVSGGQTGVDRAALRAARACGLAVGGWCPPERGAEDGPIPEELPLQETPSERSPEAPEVPRSLRTEWNVRDSDATLILRAAGSEERDPGTDWAERCAARYARPLLTVDPADPAAAREIGPWLAAHPVRTLNIAGPAESTSPGIGDQAYALLLEVLAQEPRDRS